MLERWYPTAHVPSVFAIDYEKLSALGYKGILFDIDNTLVHNGDDSTPEVDALFRHPCRRAVCAANSTEKNSLARSSEKVNTGHDFGGKCCCSLSDRQTTKRANSTGKNSFAQ